ncbi:OmpP1/FadL family transporter [Paraburkholderia caribensis]|uniref:OmpP1/FadL family transporter n=1 Tax=Paraburkholderia caribensis TaxID=75105 RepID=UPI000721AD6E|nr:outer membrane protein transport protein [Paraburkholderia caribensis]ALP68687.1 aromatic hydrocarbon degradation protein [Paraburkholderia caribensis]AUT58052.1 aromatic hydrocarbon degradation protein [Paraburkholderia caribensis]CAG9219556.1 Membrane protein involved in aromatic hydrocarbon degradation [Paraburkholderia caribensis]
MSKQFGSRRCAGALAAGVVAALYAGNASAVDGISLSGTGVKAAGMAGTSIAFPQDSSVAADNPAGMGLIGSRTDFGIQILEPLTDFEYGSPSNTLHTGKVYPVPDGGANWQISPRLTLGVSLFGTGIGTSYGRPALPIPGAGVAQSSLQTVIAAPTVTYRLTEHNIIGVSLSLAYQRFSANGVIVPTEDGTLQPLPSHGISDAFGYGMRVGYIWQPTSAFTFGASYASRIRMSKLSGYQDDLLAAGGGRIDIGAQYGVGIAYQPVPSLTLAADWFHVEFSNTVIGSAQGFGWQNQDFFRLGASWDLAQRWTLRAGFSRGNHPIGPSVVAQNLLSAMPVSSSVAVGATYRIGDKDEVSGVFEYGFPVTVKGEGASLGFNEQTKTEVFGVSYGHKF